MAVDELTDNLKDLELIFAIVDKQAVIAAYLPQSAIAIDKILGVEKPKDSILKSNEWAQANQKFNLTPYGTLLIQPNNFVSILLGSTKQETWLSTILKAQGAEISESCRKEAKLIANKLPKIVGGFNSLNDRSIDFKIVYELESQLANSLMQVVPELPGYSNTSNSALELAYSFDAEKFIAFTNQQAEKIIASPYQCEYFEVFNNLASDHKEMQEIQYGFGLPFPLGLMLGNQFSQFFKQLKGINFKLNNFNFEDKRIENASLLIATPVPEQTYSSVIRFLLLSAGNHSAPISLQASQEPKALNNLGELGEFLTAPAWIAANNKAIALTVGADGAQSLKSELSAKAPAIGQSPLLSFSFMSDIAVRASESKDEALAYLGNNLIKKDFFKNKVERQGFAVYLTKNGIENDYKIKLKQ